MSLPIGQENVECVEKIIEEYQLSAQVIKHPQTAITSLQSHLDLYGGTPQQVLKCLCMVSKGRPLVVMASGEIIIDTKKLEKISGFKEIRMARGDEMQTLFGRVPGGVDCLSVAESMPLFADQKLFEKEWVVGSSGSPY